MFLSTFLVAQSFYLGFLSSLHVRLYLVPFAQGRYAPGCVSLEQARMQVSSGTPRTGVGTQQVGTRTRELERGGVIYSAQERVPTPVPSEDDEEEMTYDQRRLIRRFRKGRWPSTAQGLGAKNFKR
jgi:hypothetical protein